MSPLIFVLSLCLGYAYERTGNLWVPITIHALFNTIETVYSLYAL
jgi:membrane protease YdiL (CAAX protease family)